VRTLREESNIGRRAVAEVTIRTLDEQPTLVVRGKVLVAGIPEFLGRAFHSAAGRAAECQAQLTGPPFAQYRPLDCECHEFEVIAGFPVAGLVTGSGEVEVDALPGGPAAVAWHIGPYETMVPTYDAVSRFVRQRHAEPIGAPWEVYHSDAEQEPDPTEWRTEIVQPFSP
jgi:effector-binding domain-containing protein